MTIRMMQTAEIPTTGMSGMDRNHLPTTANIFSVSAPNSVFSLSHVQRPSTVLLWKMTAIFSPVSWKAIRKIMRQTVRCSTICPKIFAIQKDLTHLLYASQVLQGMAIKYGVDHWRRNRGRCMGTLYWQINDDWPAPSWSALIILADGKPLHYMAQKFYAPHAVSMTLEDHRCHVYFSNESFETTEYSLTLSIRDLSGNVLETYETKGNSPGLFRYRNSSCRYLFLGRSKRRCIFWKQ